jgi:hypothetical protein
MTYDVTWVSLIHSEPGVGKSWLLDTIPAPRLVLDAEGGSRFAPSRPKYTWRPEQYAPPGVEGCEPGMEGDPPPTTIVDVRDFQTLTRTYHWLNAGRHRFRSLGLDSITEAQKRLIDQVTGGAALPTQQGWGDVLVGLEDIIRKMRDLRTHPTAPLQVVCALALTDPEKKGARRPAIRGQVANAMSGFYDTVSYLSTQLDEEGRLRRVLTSAPFPGVEAKDRTDAIPPVCYVADPKEGLPGYDMASLLELVRLRHGEEGA